MNAFEGMRFCTCGLSASVKSDFCGMLRVLSLGWEVPIMGTVWMNIMVPETRRFRRKCICLRKGKNRYNNSVCGMHSKHITSSDLQTTAAYAGNCTSRHCIHSLLRIL
ncbi:hypothetical protein CIPAW_14G086800 [Carya illinoinensis]|uniref:Uncharacterized protein n=1 Tax=Carya illinoinensis TaxID=32201 RepID=A0A8T1NJY8_CARIL|nr:hypothetical protein CIPAW_14G086800 [Carya illinoinensis]